MTTSTRHRLARDERGIVAIELALLTPILIMLLIGLIDVGRVFHRQMTLDRAVRAAADYAVAIGATSGSLEAVRAAVERVAPDDPSGTRVIRSSMTCLCGAAAATCGQFCSDGRSPDAFVNVGLEEIVEAIMPYPQVGQSIRVSSTATVRVN
jgi:uncharacterized membrane protein